MHILFSAIEGGKQQCIHRVRGAQLIEEQAAQLVTSFSSTSDEKRHINKLGHCLSGRGSVLE